MAIEVEVGGVYEIAADLTPTGVVNAFVGVSAPDGWLMCDGSAVNRETYRNLFDVIGISFGEGEEGGTTFNLPDLRGQFIRGVDHGVGNDPDAGAREASNTGGNTGDNVGSKQESAMWGHWHRLLTYGSYGGGFISPSSLNYDGISIIDNKVTNALSDGTHGEPNLSSESRPRNVYMNYIIKT